MSIAKLSHQSHSITQQYNQTQRWVLQMKEKMMKKHQFLVPKAFIRVKLNFSKNTQKQPKMTKKHQNDQKCQKHEKRPKMTKKHQKWPKIVKNAKNRKVSNLGGPPGGPPGPEKKSVTK